jgi:hypothetical protein
MICLDMVSLPHNSCACYRLRLRSGRGRRLRRGRRGLPQFAAINRAPFRISGKSPTVCGGPRVQAAGKFVGVPSGRQDQRPSPEALLEAARREESRQLQ